MTLSGEVASFDKMDKIAEAAWAVPGVKMGGVEGRRMTSWPSLRTDLENAGANWVDEEVVT